MNKWKTFALCAACLATLSFAMPDYADAARLGGGRSFGSSSIMSRPATPPSGAFRGGTSSVNRQAPLNSTRADGGAATMARSNTGLLGGLFGGLLAGTFLGSLFGGHGMMAGGMMGEFSPAMARAVAESPAQKVLVPVSRCGVQVAGLEPKPLGGYIADAAELILKQCRGGTV